MLGQQDNGKGYVEVDQITEQVDRDKAILFSLCTHVIGRTSPWPTRVAAAADYVATPVGPKEVYNVG